MSASHVGDETTGGLSRLCQRLDVARVAGTHLDDGDVVFGGQSEECLGHPHIVVEVALRVEHVVLLLQHGGNELLCGRLAVGARNADDGYVELSAMLACQVLESLETVGDPY